MESKPQRYAAMAIVEDNPDSWTLLGFIWDGVPEDKHILDTRIVNADVQFFSRAANRVFDTAHTDYSPSDVVGDSVRFIPAGESIYIEDW
jgi:hypothetical protein